MLLLCINRISISIRIVIFLLPHWLTPNCMIGDVKYDFHRCGAHTLTHTHIPFHICKHHLADQPTWKFHTSKKFNNILKRARLPNMWCGLWCDVICHVSQSLVNFSFFLSLSLSLALCQNFIFICHELAFDQCDNHEQIFFVIAFNGWHVFFYPPIYSPVALSYYEFFLYNNNG